MYNLQDILILHPLLLLAIQYALPDKEVDDKESSDDDNTNVVEKRTINVSTFLLFNHWDRITICIYYGRNIYICAILPMAVKICDLWSKKRNTFCVIATKLHFQISWLKSLCERNNPFVMHNV